jgi:hypothetical protein
VAVDVFLPVAPTGRSVPLQLLPEQAVGPLVAVGIVASLTIPFAFGYWVSADVAARGGGEPRVVAVASVLFPFGPLVYLYVRSRLGDRRRPVPSRARLAGAWGLCGICALLLAATLAPPDPFTHLALVGCILGATAPVLWLVRGRFAPSTSGVGGGKAP